MLWEYTVVAHTGGVAEFLDALNAAGQDRWELVAVTEHGNVLRGYLKRFKTMADEPRRVLGR